MERKRATAGFLLPSIVAAAAYCVIIEIGQRRAIPVFTVDLYQYFYPNVFHALRALAHGDRGLFWNPFQNCGQPFFAISQTGLLYPANSVFLVLGPDAGLRVIFFFNLLVASVGMYGLCRELGIGLPGATAGAMTFDLGPAMATLVTWNPMAAAPYSCLPVVIWMCERTLRLPGWRHGALLGVVLGVSLLAGFPQVVLFAYQLIALRVVWELATRRESRRWEVLLATALGLVIGPLLAAIQLLPSMAEVRDSIRSSSLSISEIGFQGFLNWRMFCDCVASKPPFTLHAISGTCSPFVVLPAMMASIGLLRRGKRRIAFFYLVTGLLCFALSFGPNTPLFALYLRLPLAAIFRGPERFLWITSFCLAVLAALGVDSLMSGRGAGRPSFPYAPLVSMTAVLIGFWIGSGGNLSLFEATLAGVAIVASAAGMIVPRWHPVVRWIPFAAVLLDLTMLTGVHPQRLLPGIDQLFADREALAALRGTMSAQDRAYLVRGGSLFEKSASLYTIPTIDDYEPLTARRYAEFFMVLRTGRKLESVNEYFWRGLLPLRLNARLLALTASRYLVLDASGDIDGRARNAIEALEPRPSVVRIDGHLEAYENPQALQRAFYVPRIEVVPDADEVLRRLAFGSHDLRRVALVEAPVSSFLGADGSEGPGKVTFVKSEPEELELTVDAPERGFLFLADQYAEGWRAQVDGRPAPIVRANYAFRLVEVPKGRSVVRFNYAAPSLRLGAFISIATLSFLGLAVLWIQCSTRRELVG